MRRMLLVLTVALVMVAMILATALPVFASPPDNPGQACNHTAVAANHAELPFGCN